MKLSALLLRSQTAFARCGAAARFGAFVRGEALAAVPDGIRLCAAPPASMNGFGPRPLPAAIAAMVRPEATERSSASSASPSPSCAYSSRCLISSQLVRLPPLAIVLHPHQHPAAVQALARRA